MDARPTIDTTGVARDEKARIQGDRLHSLVELLATCGNPFWAERLGDVDPGSIRSVADLPSLPLTAKADLRDNYPLGLVLTPMADTTRLHASSGTSGKPTIVV